MHKRCIVGHICRTCFASTLDASNTMDELGSRERCKEHRVMIPVVSFMPSSM